MSEAELDSVGLAKEWKEEDVFWVVTGMMKMYAIVASMFCASLRWARSANAHMRIRPWTRAIGVGWRFNWVVGTVPGCSLTRRWISGIMSDLDVEMRSAWCVQKRCGVSPMLQDS